MRLTRPRISWVAELETPSDLDATAVRLRIDATRLEGAVERDLTPIIVALPTVWIGPAGDRLLQESVQHRTRLIGTSVILRGAAGRLVARASSLRANVLEPTRGVD